MAWYPIFQERSDFASSEKALRCPGSGLAPHPPWDAYDDGPGVFRRLTHNDDAGVRHEVVLAIVFKVEADLKTSGNPDTFFNNGMANSRALSDPYTRHEHRGLNQAAVFDSNTG